MSLRDEHLKKALQHAPDSDVAPNATTRKVVLDYAEKALAPSRESWFTRVISAFNNWQIPTWQLTGMGSLAASLLVVVMILHENPDDPIQVASAPEASSSIEPKPKLAQTELAKDEVNQAEQSPQVAAESASVAASAEIAAPKLHDKVEAKTKSAKQAIETASQATAIKAPSDKTVLASAPVAASAQGLEEEADSTKLKERAASNEAAPPAPVAAAPVPQSATASAGASADAASEQAVARAAARPGPVNRAAKKMEDAEQAQAKAKADLPSAIATKPALQSSALALALGKQGGQALANADIQAGKLRILYISNTAESGAVDETTGYRKEAVIMSEEANSKSLAAEIEAYNQTMREWHLNH